MVQPRSFAPLTALVTILYPNSAAAFINIVYSGSYSYLSESSWNDKGCATLSSASSSSATKRTMICSSNHLDGVATTKRIGIIGGGAAGLAAARAFLRTNDRIVESKQTSQCDNAHVQFEVTVFESRNSIGGIWKYEPTKSETKSRPMYRNLRTNLPKELMAFRELPWGGDGTTSSYVTHEAVQEYLEEYANKFNLLACIRFGCTVTHLKVLNDDHHTTNGDVKSGDSESWPQISLEWTDNNNNIIDTEKYLQIFDAVCICNGHYAIPSTPPIQGLVSFHGKVLHAIEYDDPNDFVGQTVLCIGARASGMDISREIGCVAHRVYLSDSSCQEMQTFGNVLLMPRTQFIDENGSVHFYNAKGGELSVDDVDTIIFCSGYDYSFPFINGESNLELMATLGERRVRPLYEQLWHAHYPSLTFLGIPHSVVPFPLFELQSAAIASQWTNKSMGRNDVNLPSLLERIASADRDADSGGPDTPGRVVDTHILGSYQWNYCRNLATIAGIYDDAMENYIATNEAIYNRSGMERKAMEPGERDSYRETRFRRLDGEKSYDILYSEVPHETVTGI